MKALSVRAPWWWAMFHLGKDIENRDRATRVRGPIAIHASGWYDAAEIAAALDFALSVASATSIVPPAPFTPALAKTAAGHLIGTIDLTDCVSSSASPWFFGRYGYTLCRPTLFPKPIPWRAMPGFFDVPDAVISEALTGLAASPFTSPH